MSAQGTSPGPLDVRLRLGEGEQHGPLDGAWWPHTRDLGTEGAALVTALRASFGTVQRVLFSRPDWERGADGRPAQWFDQARGVRAGSFASDDTHVVTVQTSSGRRLRLLVVPPDTDPEKAEQLIADACDADDVRSAGQLLGEDWQHQGAIGRDIWDDDPGM